MGLIMLGTQPVQGASVVLCTDLPGMIFSGPHPCADHLFSYEATTDADGRYAFVDIPIGEYYITWLVPDGEWKFFIGGDKLVVLEGIINEAPVIDAAED
jgi:hypothetical protein